MRDDREFYIGWEAKAAPGIGSTVRKAVAALVLVALLVAVALAVAQRTIGVSAFEWGSIKEFSGVFRSRPYPHLLVARPGAAAGQEPFSTYYLVKPFKFGLDQEMADRLDGQTVSLKGTLIYRENEVMLEVVGDSFKPLSSGATVPPPEPVSLGQQTFEGEIVDSKCFLGVMNPGNLATHRACAIRCISGGIPPILFVRTKEGPPLYLLLVSASGQPVNRQVLDLVAEPVRITGELVRQGDWLILRADPASYRRTGN